MATKHNHPPQSSSPPESLSILQQAHAIIYGDREQVYGDPAFNLKNIAAYWSIHLSAVTRSNVSLTPDDVCVMMISLKLARLANTPHHTDSVIDIAGYAGLLDRINSLS